MHEGKLYRKEVSPGMREGLVAILFVTKDCALSLHNSMPGSAETG